MTSLKIQLLSWISTLHATNQTQPYNHSWSQSYRRAVLGQTKGASTSASSSTIWRSRLHNGKLKAFKGHIYRCSYWAPQPNQIWRCFNKHNQTQLAQLWAVRPNLEGGDSWPSTGNVWRVVSMPGVMVAVISLHSNLPVRLSLCKPVFIKALFRCSPPSLYFQWTHRWEGGGQELCGMPQTCSLEPALTPYAGKCTR